MPSLGRRPDAQQCCSGSVKHRVIEPIGRAIEVAGLKVSFGRREGGVRLS
jgi:hypothetical protein